MKFRLGCTFSHFGKKSEIENKKFITKDNYTIDNSEFVGTNEEHHSGGFETVIKVNKKSNVTLLRKVLDYLKENDLEVEFFTVSRKGVLLFTEENIKKQN